MIRSRASRTAWTAAFLLFHAVGARADPARTASTFETRIERAVTGGFIDDLRSLRAALEDRGSTAGNRRYNLAYLDWRISQLLPRGSKKEKKRLLKEARRQIELLLDEEPSNAEAHAMRGTVIGERITGMFSGMVLGPKASSSLKRAFELGPDNPRIALQRGIGYFFTPGAFGGGTDKAERELQRARELFDRERPDKAWPNWGRVDALAWLGQTFAKAGKLDEACSTYRAALDLEPDHAWIRGELVPALDTRCERVPPGN